MNKRTYDVSPRMRMGKFKDSVENYENLWSKFVLNKCGRQLLPQRTPRRG